MTHWQTWHDDYADPSSSLSRRLRIVQRHIHAWLDLTSPRRVRVLSVCAGDGRDLLEVLAHRSDADRVSATLVELDPGLAGRARASAARLPGVEVRSADAGDPAVYAGLPAADLVLLCGVLGNVSDADVHRTLSVLPALCNAGAWVIWTRTRRAPDLTPLVRSWLGDHGFGEVAFEPVPDSAAAVGVADLVSPPGVTLPPGRLFTFLDVSAASTNATTLAAYEQRADVYRATTTTPPEWHLDFLRRIAGRLPQGARVLELGSGTGQDARFLAGLGLAVQPSDAAVAFLVQMRDTGLRPLHLDVLTDDLGGPWDAVLAVAVLLHLTPQELDEVLERLHAAVARGGLIAVSLKEGDGPGWSSHKLGLPRYFTYWRAAPLRALMARRGWHVVVLEHRQGRRDDWLQVIATREDRPGAEKW